MGEWSQDDLWAAIGAPEMNDNRPEARRARSMKPGLIVVLSVVLAPAVLLSVAVYLWFGLLIASAGAEGIDEHLNSVPFEPGRWESDGGKYWVELRADGTGAMRLPGDPPTAFTCDQAMLEGDATYTFTPSGHGTYGALDVRLDTPDNPHCLDYGPYLAAGGWSYGGYNWDELLYSKGDPDVVDVVLHRAD